MKKITIAFLKTVGILCCLAGITLILRAIRLAFGETAIVIFLSASIFVIFFIGFYKMSK